MLTHKMLKNRNQVEKVLRVKCNEYLERVQILIMKIMMVLIIYGLVTISCDFGQIVSIHPYTDSVGLSSGQLDCYARTHTHICSIHYTHIYTRVVRVRYTHALTRELYFKKKLD